MKVHTVALAIATVIFTIQGTYLLGKITGFNDGYEAGKMMGALQGARSSR